MPYYCFNRCSEDAIKEIEIYRKKLHLVKKHGCSPPAREYEGPAFKRKTPFNRSLLVVYNPWGKYLLSIQTASSVTHKQKDVRQVLRRFIQIAKPTEISDYFSLYDLEEFK